MVVAYAGTNGGPMADPPGSNPNFLVTNAQGATGRVSLGTFAPSLTPRKRRNLRGNDEITTTARSNPEYADTGDGTGRVTTKEVRQLINNLKEIINHQTAVIESTKTDLLEVKQEQQALKDTNKQLTEEVQALRKQVERLPATPPATPPTRSWAAVVANTDNLGQPTTNQHNPKEQNCVRISTPRTCGDPQDNEGNSGNIFGRYLPTAAANTQIRAALLSTPPTQDVQVAGIGTTKTGYVVRFKDPGSADVARNNTEWLTELGNDTKLVKPRFGVAVHRTPTEEFNLDGDKHQAIQKIMEENELTKHGHQIEDLAWLKKKDKALDIMSH